MLELIVACTMSISDMTCPMVITAHSGVRWPKEYGNPTDVCLENDSDQVGTLKIECFNYQQIVIKVSPNIHRCAPEVS